MLLRSIVDGWIVAHYIVVDDSGGRARSYALRGLTENQRFWTRFKRLVENDAEHADEHLRRANVASRDDLDERIASLGAKIVEFRGSGIPNFPPLANCAQQLGGEFEYMYLWFYGLVLSDRAHLGPRTVLAYLFAGEYDPASRVRQIRQVLASALALNVDLLRLASQRFGRPTTGQLSRFEQQLDVEQQELGQ